LRQFAVQLLLARLGLQVGRQQLNAFMQLAVGGRVVLLHRVAARRFELEAGCAHLAASHQRGRTRQVERQAQDADALKGLESGGGCGCHML
jgi:hypothetical protein